MDDIYVVVFFSPDDELWMRSDLWRLSVLCVSLLHYVPSQKLQGLTRRSHRPSVWRVIRLTPTIPVVVKLSVNAILRLLCLGNSSKCLFFSLASEFFRKVSIPAHIKIQERFALLCNIIVQWQGWRSILIKSQEILGLNGDTNECIQHSSTSPSLNSCSSSSKE